MKAHLLFKQKRAVEMALWAGLDDEFNGTAREKLTHKVN